MKPLYIFDLDGTLALIGHRRHYVERAKGKKQDWAAFHAACVDDLPNAPVIETMRRLWAEAEVRIFSGRSDEVREQTEAWLAKHRCYPGRASLTMRAAGDFTPDDVLKRRWYEALPAFDRRRLVAVFDDRDRVVAMWRALGVTCFQVAPGDF